ncbi:MAG: carboxymuconolactone decarboxylase family protein [Phycisphaeraceae bacterium]|nr:carboxymuconolactone decarboxylase family protein [Phycisphaerae bacterium]MBX3393271.1 carboxymuconolactone decarboxylase family protein [Phycisphaeraceae bacterium]HRJ50984.1 carboxymuconolactone decarboxylase family protein [Phycisphaerales bacterium]
MPRLTPVDPAAATGRVREILDGPLAGKHFNIFRSMAHSPAALEAYLGMAGALEKASLSAKEREVIQLAIGSANNCAYCQAAHTAVGKMVGLSESQTVEARRGAVASDAKLDALAKFVLAVHEKKGHISDDDLARFKAAGYTEAHVAEAIAGYALAIYTNTFNHVNDTPVDFPAPPAI